MIHFLVLVMFAQLLNPLLGQQAYTTSTQNGDTEARQMGLATLNGRYAITPFQNCDDLQIGQNILIYPSFQLPPWLTLSTLDGAADGGCIVHIDGQMDATPCFTGDDGLCDVALDPPADTDTQ